MRRGKNRVQLYPKLTVEYKDDPILLAELIKLILSFIETDDAEKEHATLDIDNL